MPPKHTESQSTSPPPLPRSGRTLVRVTPRATPVAPTGRPTPGESRSLSFRSGGTDRRFVVYLPADRAPRAIVLNLHGSTSYPEEQLAISDFRAVADRHGFIVVLPEAVDTFWNTPVDPARADDVAFIREVIDRTRDACDVDCSVIHATGFSGGGRMACLLATALGDLIRAIAPVSGLRFPQPPPPRALPVLTFHGTEDPINPYLGGGFPYWQTGVEEAVAAWVAHNGDGRVREGSPEPSVSHRVYGSGDARVVLYRIRKLGHQWPGSPVDVGAPFGPRSTAVSATTLIADFFETVG